MFSRYFWMLFAVLLVVAVVSISAEESEEDLDIEFDDSDLSIESRKSFGKKVEKILKKFFKHVNDHCIKKAIKKCKKHWYNPSKVIKCAKDLFSVEGALCLVS